MTDNQRNRFLHGGELFLSRLEIEGDLLPDSYARVYDRAGVLLGLGKSDSTQLKVQCVLLGGEDG